MLSYYLRLAMTTIRQYPYLSGLTVLVIGLGIASFTVSFNLLYMMSADPIPQKSAKLFRVQLDNWPSGEAAMAPDLPPEQVTWTDAGNLIAAARAKRQAASAFSWGMVDPQGATTPFLALLRLTSADFFPMFDVPFLYGNAWDRQTDHNREQVVVLSKAMNEQLFFGENSVGKTIVLVGQVMTVVGVLDDWHPSPKFFDLSLGAFYEPEDLYLPLHLKQQLELPHGGSYQCPIPLEGDDYDAFLRSECVNFQLWVELEDQQQKDAYVAFLTDYVQEQKLLGRFPKPINNQLSDVMQWLRYKNVVNGDLRIINWLSVMFLLVCLINAASLMSTKYNHQGAEIGLRRALGASYADILKQHLVEAAMLGLAGGALGGALAYAGLRVVSQLYDNYEQLAQLNMTVVLVALAVGMATCILACVGPIWQACRHSQAMQLKHM